MIENADKREFLLYLVFIEFYFFCQATRSPPWHEFQPFAAMFAIGNDEKPVPELPAEYSQKARDFVRLCLVRDPDQRPSATQLLEHEFLKQPEEFK